MDSLEQMKRSFNFFNPKVSQEIQSNSGYHGGDDWSPTVTLPNESNNARIKPTAIHSMNTQQSQMQQPISPIRSKSGHLISQPANWWTSKITNIPSENGGDQPRPNYQSPLPGNSSVDALPCTSHGRRVVPPLEWWKGERLQVNQPEQSYISYSPAFGAGAVMIEARK